jgi:hypothetical protein
MKFYEGKVFIEADASKNIEEPKKEDKIFIVAQK